MLAAQAASRLSFSAILRVYDTEATLWRTGGSHEAPMCDDYPPHKPLENEKQPRTTAKTYG